MTRDEQIIAIANAFGETMQQWLTTDELVEVRKRNATYGPGICATHDFCDANMAMAPAFELVTGHELDGENEDDCKLWGEAWGLAKRLYFT